MKKLFTYAATLLLATTLSQFASAQSNYQPGVIIMPQGDTVRGLIDYRNWEKNPKAILFKANPEGTEKEYNPLTIKAFSVNDEVYESGLVNIETSPTKLGELSDTHAPQYQADTTFLLNIVSGSKGLYHYKAPSGKDFYYTKSGAAYDLLVYKQYATNTDGRKVVNSNNLFLNQLALYLKDCPTIQTRLKNTKYMGNSLSKAFYTYYACTEEKVAAKVKNRKPNELSVVVGPSLTNVYFKGLVLDGKTSFATKGITGGVSWNIFAPRNLARWSFNNELLFSNFSFNGSRTYFVHSQYFIENTYEFGYSYLKLNNMLRYKHSVGKAAVFVNAGISNGYAFHEKNAATSREVYYTTDRTRQGLAFEATSKYEQGYLLGIGAGYGKVSGEARYERSNGFLDYRDASTDVKRYSFLLGYRF